MKSQSKAIARLRLASSSSTAVGSKPRRSTAAQPSRASHTQLLSRDHGAPSIFTKPLLGSTFVRAAQAVKRPGAKSRPAVRRPLPSIDLSLISHPMEDQPPEIDEIQELVSSIESQAEVSEAMSDLDGFLVQTNLDEEVQRLTNELHDLKAKVCERDQLIRQLTRQVREKEVALQDLRRSPQRKRGCSPSALKKACNS